MIKPPGDAHGAAATMLDVLSGAEIGVRLCQSVLLFVFATEDQNHFALRRPVGDAADVVLCDCQ
jgi:hypothetical protein